MKFVSYLFHESFEDHDEPRLGLLIGDEVIDLEHASGELGTPLGHDIIAFLRLGEPAMTAARHVEEMASSDPNAFRDKNARKPLSALKLLAPVPRHTSMRDAYDFRQHVESARLNR